MKPDCYHLDYETYSPENLKKVGAFKYAAHPESEVLIMAIAKNDEPVLTWDFLNGGDEAIQLLAEAVRNNSPVWAHNAQFEFAVTKHNSITSYPPKLEQWHCTAALCRLAAINSSLAGAGEFLELSQMKDTDGDRLIKKFSVPRKPTKDDPRSRIMPEDDPEDFQKFVDYCIQDVEAERELHHKIKAIDQKAPSQEHFQADMRMNDRGIPINVEALTHANKLIDEYEKLLVPRFSKQVASEEIITLPITGQRKAPKDVDNSKGFRPSQRELMMTWMKARGFTGSDLTADTVTLWLDPKAGMRSKLTPEAQEALETYSLVGSAAIKKIPAMLNMAMDDGYVRGALMIYGAERTHRWTGKGIQPQNFARPSIKFTELAYECIQNKATIDELEALFGDLYAVLASCIRHFIQPHGGKEVLQADYSAIEARVAPWLCGEEKTLKLFRQGQPLYEIMATRIFGGSVEDITSEQRFIGKQAVLGCSYNMGRPKFRGTCESYGFAPSDEMVEEYKPRHAAFVAKAIKKAADEISRKYEKKGQLIPARFVTDPTHFERKAMEMNGWKTLKPQTMDEWRDFAFDELADRAVTTWRNENPIVVRSWRALDDAAKSAIQDTTQTFTVGKIAFRYIDAIGFPSLCLKLPSGHYLVYPHASVVKNESRGWGTQIKFWGVIPNTGGKWGWCFTYGGKLLENATQGCAGDVMREGMMAAEAEGYHPFMLVHDELLATKEDDSQTHERLCELLCTMPDWAKGLPLAAEGGTIPFYKK